MKSLLSMAALAAVWALTSNARAQPGEVVQPIGQEVPPASVTRYAPVVVVRERPTPRLKLSYERFSAGNIDGSDMPLEALHLDMYPLSWQWFRGGVDLEAGRGHATVANASARVEYGLAGVNAGLQLPGRITPFVEGRFAAGILGGTLEGSLTIPGTAVSLLGVSAATWLYARGANAGVEIYTFGRGYVSLGAGWVRTTWGSATYEAMVTNMGGSGLRFVNVNHDSFLFKVGLGI
jgi:hypothetical protein